MSLATRQDQSCRFAAHTSISAPRDLFVILRDHYHEDELLVKFWEDVNRVPSWVRWDQIQKGQEVFSRYGAPALTGLAFQSLLGGMVRGSNSFRLIDRLTFSFRGRQELWKRFRELVWIPPT